MLAVSNMLDQTVDRVAGPLRDRHDQTCTNSFGQLRAHCFDALDLSWPTGHLGKGHSKRIFIQQFDYLVSLRLDTLQG